MNSDFKSTSIQHGGIFQKFQSTLKRINYQKFKIIVLFILGIFRFFLHGNMDNLTISLQPILKGNHFLNFMSFFVAYPI